MTVAIYHRQFAPAIAPAWRLPLAALAVAWLALLAIFHRDAFDMSRIAWTVSTYSHCLLVPPVIAWLVWQRRTALAGIAPQAWWPGLAWVGAGGLGWLLGDAAGVAIARHLGLVMMLQGSVVTLLGPHVARALAFPLGYALFLVPFGEFLIQPLQTLTAYICIGLLHLFGVPLWTDGVLIRIPNGYFEVAEACAGANFVLAMAAFATLAAHVGFVSPRRRLLFMLGALATPVLANGVRAFATIYVAWWTTAEAAAGFDHIVYGWVFFALVVALVVGVAWRFFDRPPGGAVLDPARFPPPSRHTLPLLGAFALVLAVAGAPALWSAAMASRTAALTDAGPPAIAGWQATAAPSPAWAPHYAGADLQWLGHYRDASGATVDLGLAAFARQEEGRELVGYGQGALTPDGAWMWTSAGTAAGGGRAERITGPGGVVREVVTLYRIGGVTTGSQTWVKLLTLRARLLGGSPAAVAVTVSSTDRAALDRFLAAMGPVDRIADAAVATR